MSSAFPIILFIKQGIFFCFQFLLMLFALNTLLGAFGYTARAGQRAEMGSGGAHLAITTQPSPLILRWGR